MNCCNARAVVVKGNPFIIELIFLLWTSFMFSLFTGRKLTKSKFKSLSKGEQKAELIAHGWLSAFPEAQQRGLPTKAAYANEYDSFFKGRDPFFLTEENANVPEDEQPIKSIDMPEGTTTSHIPGYNPDVKGSDTEGLNYFQWYKPTHNLRNAGDGMTKPLPQELESKLPDMTSITREEKLAWAVAFCLILKNFNLSWCMYLRETTTIGELPGSIYVTRLSKASFDVAKLLLLVLAQRLCDMKLVGAHGVVRDKYANGCYAHDLDKAWLQQSGYVVLGGDGCWAIRGYQSPWGMFHFVDQLTQLPVARFHMGKE